MQANKKKNNFLFYIFQFIFLFIVLIFCVVGTNNLLSDAKQEGTENTKQAIEHAAVMCYAIEGFYPPGLTYIEENYGVQIDKTQYTIRYDIFASNVMPQVIVSVK